MTPQSPNQENELNKVKKEANSYIRYSGIGFQMIAIIGICTFIGYEIDKYRGSQELIFSALLGLLGVCASLYIVIASLKDNQS